MGLQKFRGTRLLHISIILLFNAILLPNLIDADTESFSINGGKLHNFAEAYKQILKIIYSNTSSNITVIIYS